VVWYPANIHLLLCSGRRLDREQQVRVERARVDLGMHASLQIPCSCVPAVNTDLGLFAHLVSRALVGAFNRDRVSADLCNFRGSGSLDLFRDGRRDGRRLVLRLVLRLAAFLGRGFQRMQGQGENGGDSDEDEGFHFDGEIQCFIAHGASSWT